MAIQKMKKILIIGLNKDRKAVLEYLHRQGKADFSGFSPHEYELGTKETTSYISQFEYSLADCAAAIEILDRDFPQKKGMFSKRSEISDEYYHMSENEASQMSHLARAVINAKKQLSETKDDISKITVAKNLLDSYIGLDIPVKTQHTKTSTVRVGVLEGQFSAETLAAKMLESDLNDCYIEIVNSTKTQTLVVFIYPKDKETEYSKVFSSINLLAPPVNTGKLTPAEKLKELEAQEQSLYAKINQIQSDIEKMSASRDKLKLYYDHLAMRKQKYEVLAKVGLTENTFIMSGFLPEEDSEDLKNKLLSEFEVEVIVDEPDSDDTVPIKFRNNAVVEPVEGITTDFSIPSENDIDPNPIMAFFYYWFFGMMFSDAGYGLIMMIACALLGFGEFLDREKRRAYKMFFYCGVSTTFWGIMYGSFFGDLITVISQTFGDGKLALTPILMDPVKEPLNLMIMSIAFGIIHILFALGIKFHMLWRRGKKDEALFDVGFWILLLGGIGVLAGGMISGITLIYNVGIALAIAGVVGLLITQGRGYKNPFAKLFGGIISLYDITSYVGDALSYSRLMALGLTTGVIASVVNVLCAISGGGIKGVIMFIVIGALGHSLNFAINALGAYVHTNRLQYVEFYQKFYEGGGKKFAPFEMKTKYYNFIKEKE